MFQATVQPYKLFIWGVCSVGRLTLLYLSLHRSERPHQFHLLRAAESSNYGLPSLLDLLVRSLPFLFPTLRTGMVGAVPLSLNYRVGVYQYNRQSAKASRASKGSLQSSRRIQSP